MLDRALALNEGGQRIAMVAVGQDRRSMLESVRARKELSEIGCDVHTIKEGGMLPNLTAHVLTRTAEDFSEQLGEKIAEVLSHAIRNGWHYGRVAFAYRIKALIRTEPDCSVRPGSAAR